MGIEEKESLKKVRRMNIVEDIAEGTVEERDSTVELGVLIDDGHWATAVVGRGTRACTVYVVLL